MDDLIPIIQSRSKAEDLGRWKLCCRQWRFDISSYWFAKKHAIQAQESEKNRRIMLSRVDDVISFYLAGSVNGLVLLFTKKNPKILVVNPLIKQTRDIPIPPIHSNNRICYSFGYYNVNDDYIIVAGFRSSDTKTYFYTFFSCGR